MSKEKAHPEETPDERATLDSMAAQIKRLEAKVDSLEATNKDQTKDISSAKNATKKAQENATYSSKTVMGGIIGLVGAKLGALIGAKVGVVSSIGNVKAMDASRLPLLSKLKTKIASSEFVAESSKMMAMKPENFSKMIVNAKAWGLGGALVVGVPTFLLGYKRGDRLAKATDLITKPIDSFHRLAESESSFIAEHPDHPLAQKKAAGNWQDKVQAERGETAADTAKPPVLPTGHAASSTHLQRLQSQPMSLPIPSLRG